LLRAEVLNRINSRKKPAIIVTYPEALKKVVTRRDLEKHLKVSVEDKISIDFINEVLFEYEFKRVDFITEFSVRGGIVDVFSFRMIIHTELSFLG
jgi:transcription-repair coupling factor (superfamily II helicase)